MHMLAECDFMACGVTSYCFDVLLVGFISILHFVGAGAIVSPTKLDVGLQFPAALLYRTCKPTINIIVTFVLLG